MPIPDDVLAMYRNWTDGNLLRIILSFIEREGIVAGYAKAVFQERQHRRRTFRRRKMLRRIEKRISKRYGRP